MKSLTDRLESLKELQKEANRSILRLRYETGRLISDIKDKAMYGDNALTELQDELDLGKTMIYDCHKIFKKFTEAEIEKAIEAGTSLRKLLGKQTRREIQENQNIIHFTLEDEDMVTVQEAASKKGQSVHSYCRDLMLTALDWTE